MVSDGEAVEPGVYRVCASNLGMCDTDDNHHAEVGDHHHGHDS